MSTNLQQRSAACADCFLHYRECDLTPLHPDADSTAGCFECAASGMNCCIPVSDASMLQQGFDTAIDGKRKCLNCAMMFRECTFPSGQRPNPCLSCIKAGAATCRIPAPISREQDALSAGYLNESYGSTPNVVVLPSFGITVLYPQVLITPPEASNQALSTVDMLYYDPSMLSPTPRPEVDTRHHEYESLPVRPYSNLPGPEPSFLVQSEGANYQGEGEYYQTPTIPQPCSVAPAGTPHSNDPSVEFSVGQSPEVSMETEPEDTGYIDEAQYDYIPGEYEYQGGAYDESAGSEDIF